MKLLAIDTAANLCAACIYDAAHERVLAIRSADVGTGHAELLMDQITACLDAAGLAYTDVERIAVAIGPGSFTGVRIGVAAARGLALALSVPAIGISTLEAIAAETHATSPGAVVAILDAGRAHFYAALYDADARLIRGPAMVDRDAARLLCASGEPTLAGSGAAMLAEDTGRPAAGTGRTAPIDVYARLAGGRSPPFERPKPLYLRPADARPQEGFALARQADA